MMLQVQATAVSPTWQNVLCVGYVSETEEIAIADRS